MPNDDRATAALRWLPSPMSLLAATAGTVLFAVAFAKGIRDADYFWHITAGRVIATTGRVPDADPFSFTWAGMPWTPHEWLSELLMHHMITAGGPILAIIVFGLLAAGVVCAVAWLLRRLDVRPAAIVLVVALVTWILAPYVTVRPQIVSWLMMALLLAGLATLSPARPWSPLLLAPFFVLWANLHGLWVVGLGVVGLYLIFTIVGRTPFAARWRWLVAGTVGAVLATMATPAGPEGVLYPLRYVDAGDWGLANIQEWQSPDFHDASHLGLLALVIGLMATGGRAAPGWMVALSWIGVAAALVALRNAPVAAVLAAPALGIGLSDLLMSRSTTGGARLRRPSIRLGRRLMELAVACAIGGVAIVTSLGQAHLPLRYDGYPVAATDLLLGTNPDSRVIGEYGWGGYLISRLYQSGGRVFIDGRNDMYSDAVLNEYSSVRDAAPGWENIADSYRADALLFPPEFTIAKVADFSQAWCEAYRDDTQVLFLRRCPAP